MPRRADPGPQLPLLLPLSGSPAKLADAEIDRLFAEWYAVYPRHDARKDGRKAYGDAIRSSAGTPSQLLEGAQAYAEQSRQRGTGKKFLCLPGTWIRGERWTDEYRPEADARSSPQRTLSAGFARAADAIRNRA